MALKKTQRRSNKAISPAVSSVIITGAMVALITVALAFASNLLSYRMAESEFDSARQFMQTLGLQIDDVAWTIGRTETARYSSRHGDVAFQRALNYTIYTTNDSGPDPEWERLYTVETGILCFNMPVSEYSVAPAYFELIYPSSYNGFLLSGASAPTARIFAVEKLPMTDGDFVRVVTVPTIRMIMLNNTDNPNQPSYIRLYLPVLAMGEAPRNSQSATLTGKSVSKMEETVTSVKIDVSFPIDGFDNFFFNFPQTEESIPLEPGTVLELYVGGVEASLGVHA